MKRNRIVGLIAILVPVILSAAICLIMINNSNDRIKIAIYPSSGGLSETYYFEIKPNGYLLVEKGDRLGNDLTQTPFMQRENPYTDRENVVYEFSHEIKKMTKSETEIIYDLVSKLYADTLAPVYRDDIMDNWDITMLYHKKVLKGNCFMDWNILNEIVDKLITVSPIDVDLRGFA